MAVSMVIQQTNVGRLFSLVGLATLVVLLMPTDSNAASVGRLAYVWGDVAVERGAASEPAERGRLVYRNDIIVTGSGGRAKLVMSDGSRVYVGSRSRIEVSDYARRGGSLFSGAFNMFWGKARFFVNKLVTRNSSFRVRTSTAVLGVRGTSFVVNQAKPKGLQDSDVQTMSFIDFVRKYPMPVRVVLQTGGVDITLPSGKVVRLIPGRTADINKRGEVRIHRSGKHDENTPPSGVKHPGVEKTGGRSPGFNSPKPPSLKQLFQRAASKGGAGGAQGAYAQGGAAKGSGVGSGSTIGSAVRNAKQNIGATTQVNIQPRFVLP